MSPVIQNILEANKPTVHSFEQPRFEVTYDMIKDATDRLNRFGKVFSSHNLEDVLNIRSEVAQSMGFVGEKSIKNRIVHYLGKHLANGNKEALPYLITFLEELKPGEGLISPPFEYQGRFKKMPLELKEVYARKLFEFVGSDEAVSPESRLTMQNEALRLTGKLLQTGHRKTLENLSKDNRLPESQRTFLSDFLRLGIIYPDRFFSDSLGEIVKNRLENRPDGRPLAVVFGPRGDRNGAFSDTSGIDQLIKKGYRVMYYEVAKDKDMIAALSQFAQPGEDKAKVVIIGGHGNTQGLWFSRQLGASSIWAAVKMAYSLGSMGGSNGTLDSGDIGKMKDARLADSIEEDATVILNSCSTGSKGILRQLSSANIKGLISRRAFADYIYKGFEGKANVFAPRQPIGLPSLVFGNNAKVVDVIYDIPSAKYYKPADKSHK